MNFLALYVDFSSPSHDHLGLRRPVHADFKEGYPHLKSGYFTAICLSNVKTAAYRHTRAVIIKSTDDELFSDINNIDDLE